MTPKEKAEEIYNKIHDCGEMMYFKDIKKCALIAIENEYRSLRELLFNLRACAIIESEKVFLFRLKELINEELRVKQEIEKL